MSERRISIKLNGSIPLDEYRKAIDSFSQLIASLSNDIAGKDMVSWRVAKLHTGSAFIEVAGHSIDAQAVDSVVAAYTTAADAVATNRPIPYSPTIRTHFYRLIKLIDGNIKSIEFGTEQVNRIVDTPIVHQDVELPAQTVSVGSISGQVETLSRRKGLYFTIYDQIFNKAVRCNMRKEQEPLMRNIWGKKAIVSGKITRDRRTGQPLSVNEVFEIEVVETSDSGDLSEFRGLLRRQPNSPSSEDRIRRLRDNV